MFKKMLVIMVFALVLTSFNYASEEVNQAKYTKVTGTLVEEILQGDNKFYNIEDENGNPVSLIVTEDSYILTETEIEVGDTISGYFLRNMPVVAIYPPQYPVNVLVKDSDYFSTKYDVFDENYLSSDGELVINISNETTEIVDRDGEAYKESIIDKPIIVIYSITTRSIPPQTSPEKIIVLNDKNESSVISDKSYELNDDTSNITVKTPIMKFGNNGEEKLINDSINFISNEMYEEQIKADKEYKEAFIATGGTQDSYIPVETVIDYKLLYLNDEYLSVVLYKTQTLANAYNESYYLNYDIKNGQLLTISDVSDTEFVEAEIIRMAKFRNEEMPSKYNYDIEEIMNISIDNDTKFYVDEKGQLVVVFDKYEIASGADGEQSFIIPDALNYKFNGVVGYYPLSKIANILGYEVKWIEDTRTVSLKMDGKSVFIPVDKDVMVVDDVEIKMKSSPIIYNETTYVDYEYISALID